MLLLMYPVCTYIMAFVPGVDVCVSIPLTDTEEIYVVAMVVQGGEYQP